MSKRSWIVTLAGVNLLLLAALWLSTESLPTARAQPGNAGGNYVAATVSVDGQQYEALYILDLTARKLHAFAPTDIHRKRLEYMDARDLEVDFRRTP